MSLWGEWEADEEEEQTVTGSPDFIPDNQADSYFKQKPQAQASSPDFISDDQAESFFNPISPLRSAARKIFLDPLPGAEALGQAASSAYSKLPGFMRSMAEAIPGSPMHIARMGAEIGSRMDDPFRSDPRAVAAGVAQGVEEAPQVFSIGDLASLGLGMGATKAIGTPAKIMSTLAKGADIGGGVTGTYEGVDQIRQGNVLGGLQQTALGLAGAGGSLIPSAKGAPSKTTGAMEPPPIEVLDITNEPSPKEVTARAKDIDRQFKERIKLQQEIERAQAAEEIGDAPFAEEVSMRDRILREQAREEAARQKGQDKEFAGQMRQGEALERAQAAEEIARRKAEAGEDAGIIPDEDYQGGLKALQEPDVPTKPSQKHADLLSAAKEFVAEQGGIVDYQMLMRQFKIRASSARALMDQMGIGGGEFGSGGTLPDWLQEARASRESPGYLPARTRVHNMVSEAFNRIKGRIAEIIGEPEVSDLEFNKVHGVEGEYRGKRSLLMEAKNRGDIVWDPTIIARTVNNPSQFVEYIKHLLTHEPAHSHGLHQFPDEGSVKVGDVDFQVPEGDRVHTERSLKSRAGYSPEEFRFQVANDAIKHDPQVLRVIDQLRENILRNPELYHDLQSTTPPSWTSVSNKASATKPSEFGAGMLISDLPQPKQPKGRPVVDRDKISEIANVPRATMTAFDLSGFRQAVVAGARHPVKAAQALWDGMKGLTSDRAFIKLNDELKADPRFKANTEAGLFHGEPGMKLNAEELYYGSRLINNAFKSVGLGHLDPVRASERGFTTMLNKLRQDVFNQKRAQLEKLGLTQEANPEIFKREAQWVNDITGRGTLPRGKGGLAQAVRSGQGLLNAIFFSPRMIASRVRILTKPLEWAGDFKRYKEAGLGNVDAFRAGVAGSALDMAAYIAYAGTFTTILKGLGAKVEEDPRSSDFGKARFGNARINPWADFQGYVVAAARMAQGEQKSKYGNVRKVSPLETGANLVRSKLAPLPAFAATVAAGKDITGKPLSLSHLNDLWMPMGPKDVVKLYQEDPALGIAFAIPILTGLNVNVHDAPSEFANKGLQEEFYRIGVAPPPKPAKNVPLGKDPFGNRVKYEMNATELEKLRTETEPLIYKSIEDVVESENFRSQTPRAQKIILTGLIRHLKSLQAKKAKSMIDPEIARGLMQDAYSEDPSEP